MGVRRCVGVTMRASDPRTGAAGDWLDPSWATVLSAGLPGWPWVPIPNVGSRAARLAGEWALGAIILTGGEDVGAAPMRDQTERALLAACLAEGRPLLGVCRGLQLIQDFFGGATARAGPEHEAGRMHAIRACDPLGASILGRHTVGAPSYHRNAVHRDALAPELASWAVAADEVVEGLSHRGYPILAAQWHPERALPNPGMGTRLLRALACLLEG